MRRITLALAMLLAVSAFTIERETVAQPVVDTACVEGVHAPEALMLYTAAPDSQGGDVMAMTEVAVAMKCMLGCCPVPNENVDCWSDGHWHINHCITLCPPD